MLLCKFCNKECKSPNSQRNHERLCKKNPNRQYTIFSDLDFQKNRNPGRGENHYTKAKRLGLEKPILSDSTKEKLSKAIKNRSDEFNKKIAQKISKTITKKVQKGDWHTSLAKNMHYEYKGEDLHGKWELKYAQFLDKNEIKWMRNKDSFSYVFDGKERKYTPDFYLPETDEYIEIKGYKTKKDEAKWSQFPSHRKLIVLMENELKMMKIID